MARSVARAQLQERAEFEAWQERTLPPFIVNNADRSYRLRNVETGAIITPDRLRFLFGRRETSANSVPLTPEEATAAPCGLGLLEYMAEIIRGATAAPEEVAAINATLPPGVKLEQVPIDELLQMRSGYPKVQH